MPQVRTARKKNRRSDKRTNQKLGRRSDKRTNHKVERRRSDKRTNHKVERRPDKRTNQKIRRRSGKRTNKKIRMREGLRVNNVMVGGEETEETIFRKIFPKFMGQKGKKTILENLGLIRAAKHNNSYHGTLVLRLGNQIENLQDLYVESGVESESPIHFYFEKIINPLFYYKKVSPNSEKTGTIEEHKTELFNNSFGEFDGIRNYKEHEKYFKNHLEIISLFIKLYDNYKNANLTKNVNIEDYLDINEIQRISNNFIPNTGRGASVTGPPKHPWHLDHHVSVLPAQGNIEFELSIFPHGDAHKGSPYYGHYIHTFVEGELKYKHNPNIFGNFPRFCKHKLYFREIELSEDIVLNDNFIVLIQKLHKSFQNYIKSSIYSIYVLIENRHERNQYMKTFDIGNLLDVYYYIEHYLVGKGGINTIKKYFNTSEKNMAPWITKDDLLKKYIAFLFEIHLNNDKIFYMLEALHDRTKIKFFQNDTIDIKFKIPLRRGGEDVKGSPSPLFTYDSSGEIPENKFPAQLKKSYENLNSGQKDELKDSFDFSDNYLNEHRDCHENLFTIFPDKFEPMPDKSHHPLYGFKLSDDCIINSSQAEFTDAVEEYGFDEYAYDLFMKKSLLSQEQLHETLMENARTKQYSSKNKIIFPLLIPIETKKETVLPLIVKEYLKQFIINKMKHAEKGEYTFNPKGSTIIPTIRFYKDILCDETYPTVPESPTERLPEKISKGVEGDHGQKRRITLNAWPEPDSNETAKIGGGEEGIEEMTVEDEAPGTVRSPAGPRRHVWTAEERVDREASRGLNKKNIVTIIGGLLTCYGDENTIQEAEMEKEKAVKAVAEAVAAKNAALEEVAAAEKEKEKARLEVTSLAQAKKKIEEEKAEADERVQEELRIKIDEAEKERVAAAAAAAEAAQQIEKAEREKEEAVIAAQQQIEKAEREKEEAVIAAQQQIEKAASEAAEKARLEAAAEREKEKERAAAAEVADQKIAEEAKQLREELDIKIKEAEQQIEKAEREKVEAVKEVELTKGQNRKNRVELDQNRAAQMSSTVIIKELNEKQKLNEMKLTQLINSFNHIDDEKDNGEIIDELGELEEYLKSCKGLYKSIGGVKEKLNESLDGYSGFQEVHIGYIEEIDERSKEGGIVNYKKDLDDIMEEIKDYRVYITDLNKTIRQYINELLVTDSASSEPQEQPADPDVERQPSQGGGLLGDLQLDIPNYNHILNGGMSQESITKALEQFKKCRLCPELKIVSEEVRGSREQFDKLENAKATEAVMDQFKEDEAGRVPGLEKHRDEEKQKLNQRLEQRKEYLKRKLPHANVAPKDETVRPGPKKDETQSTTITAEGGRTERPEPTRKDGPYDLVLDF